MELRYAIIDVFAEAPLQGNPAAIVFDADGLDTARMQAVAREFNLSETAFVLKPHNPENNAHIRLFTPRSEVPFAGHPNIGAAFALSRERAPAEDYLTFEEEAGLVQLRLDRDEGRIVGASLIAPRAVSTEVGPSPAAIAAALSLAEADVVTTTHPPITASVGLPFLFVEIANVEALARARADLSVFDLVRQSHGVEAVHLYVKWPDRWGARIQARNLSPYDGIGEDPATGSATASLTALLAQLDPDPNRGFRLEAHQGIEMGRPSLLHGYAPKKNGVVDPPMVTGRWVAVMQGVLIA